MFDKCVVDSVAFLREARGSIPNHRTREVPEFSEDHREGLARWLPRHSTAQSLALTAWIVLECATGKRDQAETRAVGVTPGTAGNWRRPFLRGG